MIQRSTEIIFRTYLEWMAVEDRKYWSFLLQSTHNNEGSSVFTRGKKKSILQHCNDKTEKAWQSQVLTYFFLFLCLGRKLYVWKRKDCITVTRVRFIFINNEYEVCLSIYIFLWEVKDSFHPVTIWTFKHTYPTGILNSLLMLNDMWDSIFLILLLKFCDKYDQ